MVRKIKVLTVCGTGGVTASVARAKIEEIFKEAGFSAEITSTQASDAEGYAKTNHPDLIVSTTPISIKGFPVIVGTSFLSGIGIEETKKQILISAKKIIGRNSSAKC